MSKVEIKVFMRLSVENLCGSFANLKNYYELKKIQINEMSKTYSKFVSELFVEKILEKFQFQFPI